MKGLNVRRLAAIAVGGALVGSALAPLAAAITLEKSNIVNSSGTPIVNVVVGTNGAAVSDFVWAGNIAAKVAQLATTETDVAGGTGTALVTDLSVDLTSGGEQSYTTDYSYTYQGTDYALKSMSNEASYEFRKNIGSGQLSFLTNKTKSYKYNSSTYEIVIKETVGIEADARFDPSSTVKDLIVRMKDPGDFNYVLDLGSGIPGWSATTATTTKFTDGEDDAIVIPFLGSEYTVQETDLVSSVKKIKLIKESAKQTYQEGSEITGLTGKGDYEGQQMTIRVGALSQATGQGAYSGSFALYDANGTLVHAPDPIAEGTYLNETFVDPNGDQVLDTVVYVSTIRYSTTKNEATLTIIVGKDVVTLADGKQYPYDATDTDTTNDYWTASFDVNTAANTNPPVATVQKITVKNNVTNWAKDSTAGPLWSTNSSLTQTGKDKAAAGGNVASFMQGEKKGTLGYDFVKLKFDGFKLDQSTTKVKIGNGSVVYKDTIRVERTIPFYIELKNTPTATSFFVSGKEFFYRCSSTDVNLLMFDRNTLNGAPVVIDSTPAGAVIYTDTNATDVNGAGNVSRLQDINGVQYEIGGYLQNGSGAIGVYLLADGNCEFSKYSFDNAEYLQLGGATDYTTRSTTGLAPIQTKTVYYDDDNATRTPLDIPLYVSSSALNDTYKYRMYVGKGDSGGSDQDDKVFLLLDRSTDFTSEFSSFTGPVFVGTDTVEAGYVVGQAQSTPYYWPDIKQMGNDPDNKAYIIANFGIDVNTDSDVNAYINTATGNLIVLPDSTNDLSSYNSDVNFIAAGLSLSSDPATTAYQAMWIDYGTKVELTDDKKTVTVTIPQSQVYLVMNVLGQGATQTTSGGESQPGIKEKATATFGSTKITVDKINYAAGTCTIAGSKSAKIVKVDELVYKDSPEPAGSHIIVGGYLVNKLAEGVTLTDGSSLEEALTGSGDTVVELLSSSGDIIVAGYTAADTVDAAKELIDELDRLVA
jgi:hypothetical protein